MGYVARFKKGSKVLDISSGIYTLSDWVPPRANIISNIAHGTSANRYGGGVKVSERAVNTSTVFSVRIKGDSNAECEEGARRIENFLRQAGDEAEPMYLEWRSDNNVGDEPYWGQFGANIRYEIVSGQIDRWNAYFIAESRNTTMFVNVMLELKPFAMGKRQKLMTAKGGILEDVIGTGDGTSRGVYIGYAATNLATNPVFGHSTFSNDWTASASMTAVENTDKEYVLFGDTSVRLETTADDQYYEQYVNMTGSAIYTVSCYIKMRDKSTPTTSQVKVRIVGGSTPTFREIGDGWWLAYKNYTAGSTDAYAVGLQIMSDVSLYFGGMQVESRSIPSRMAYGDMLGCSWAGTAHDSTSARGTAMLRLATNDLIYKNAFTVRMAWMPDFDSTFGTRAYFFDSTGANELQSYIEGGTITFKVGAASAVTSTPVSFSAGDPMLMHFVAAPGTVKAYYNGTQVAGTTAFDIPYPSTYMYVGNGTALTNPLNSTILGFSTFDKPFSAAEVLADYNNITEIINGGDGLGRQLEPVPYLWTKDGDDVVDNCNDSTRDNWAVIAGVPGGMNAETEYRLAMSNIAARQTIIGIMTNPYGAFVNPGDYLWGEYSGSADANSSGTQYYLKANVGDSGVTLIGDATVSMTQYGVEALLGRDIYMVARLYDGTASSLKLYPDTPFIPLTSIREYRTTTMPGTTWGLHYTGPISLPSRDLILQALPYTSRSFSSKAFALYGQHVSGTSNVSIDFFSIIPRPMAILGDGNAVTGAGFVLNGRKIIEVNSTFTTVYEPSYMSGDIIDLYPNQYNVLLSHIGYASDADMSRTLTYNAIYVKPRYSLA